MLASLVALIVTGGPVLELLTKEDVEARIAAGGERAVLRGTVERVEMGKGGKQWLGTAVVLDDGTPVWVTYNAPPEGWEPFVGKYVEVEGNFSRQSSLTKQSMMAPHLIKPALPSVKARPLATLLDRSVRLVGTAENAKGGAVVLIDEEPVYVSKKDAWPETLRGKRVGIGGRLVRTKYLPEAVRGPKGEISQGTEPGSSQHVLLNPSEPVAF